MLEKNSVVKKNNDLVADETLPLHATERKELHINTEDEGVNFNRFFAWLTQYVNIGDTLAHVEQEMKYVVEIPFKYQEAFNAGELSMNENSKTGVLWPTLYKTSENGRRQFVDNLPIKRGICKG